MTTRIQTPTNTIHQIKMLDDKIVLAVTPTGLMQSIDGGQSWHNADLEVPLTAILVNDDQLLCGGVGQVYRSDDMVETWEAFPLPVPTSIVSSLVQTDDCLLLGTLDDGALRSDDGGQTWRGWNFGLLDWCVLSLAVTDDHMVFAGTESGLYFSDNCGCSWRSIASEIYSPILSLCVIEGNLFIGTESGALHNLSLHTHRLSDSSIGQTINAIFAYQDDTLVMLSGNNVCVSNDRGVSWLELDWQVDNPTAIAPAKNNQLLVGTQHGGIYQLDVK